MRLTVELATTERVNVKVFESIGDILLAKTLMIGKSDDCRFSGKALILFGLLLMKGLEKVSQEGYIGRCRQADALAKRPPKDGPAIEIAECGPSIGRAVL